MKKYRGFALILTVALLTAAGAFGADFEEPKRPDVGKVFDTGKERKIAEISGLAPEEFFLQMKTDEFLSDPDLMHKAVYNGFNSRRQDILAFAKHSLMLPQADYGADRSRSRDFYVARRILETFPEEAAQILTELYKSGDAATRGNSIQAAGQVAGGEKVKQLLIQALDDRAFYVASGPEDLGEPLRVCDAAYNQLVLRYKIKNVHRTIGPALTIEVRDQLVGILKKMLLKGQG